MTPSQWIRFNKRSNACPVCAGERNDCRQNTKSEIIFCRAGIDNPAFRFVGEDINGFGMFRDRGKDEANRDQYFQQKQARQQSEARQRATSMPIAERHRHYTKILEVLPNPVPEDIADLTRRGFTTEEIERIEFRSVKAGQRLPEQFPKNLPGVSWDGRSLLIQEDGYIYPVRNAQGQILAMQLRVREATENKYRWLSSDSNYRLPNGEVPLAHCTPEIISRNWQGFSEGTGPKPYLSSVRLGCPVIGAAGGQFANSQSQVNAALESGSIPVLIPDGGAIANSLVMRQYAKLAEMVPDLKVLWWEQCQKGQDIDEISNEVLASARLITWEEFREMSPVGDLQQQLTDRFQRQRHLELIERFFKKAVKRPSIPGKELGQDFQAEAEAPINPEAGAIALYDRRNDGRLEMAIKPDKVPTRQEWIERGRPTLIVKPEERVLVLQELVLKGYPYVLIQDMVGAGKSRTAGEFFEAWDRLREVLDQVHPGSWKGVYCSPDYRRPSNEALELIPVAVSGAGLMVDESKRTPLGNPFTRRATPGETPDIPGLCINENAYQKLAAQGYPMGRSKDSKFCQQCPLFNDCGYLKAVEEQKSEPVLRNHISKISVGEGENVIGFIDEAGISIAGDVVRESKLHVLGNEISEIAKNDPYLYLEVAPLLKALQRGLERAVQEQGRYGLNHSQLMEFLPKMAELHHLMVSHQMDVSNHFDPWEASTLYQIAGRLQKAIRSDFEKQVIEASDPKHREELVEKCLTIGIIPRLINAICGHRRCDVSLSGNTIKFRYKDRRHGKAIAKLRTTFLMDATPDRQEIARNLGIDEGEIVSISSPKPSFENLTFKVVRGFGKAGRYRENYDANGDVIQSPYSTMQRILALVEQVSNEAIAINPNIQIGLLDLKAYLGQYADIAAASTAKFLTGYHFNDGRNTNRFKECSILFSVGTPVQNISDLLSRWHIKTGKSYTAETAPPTFWAWVNRLVTYEILQEGGRSRAQHRPDEQICHYILSNLTPEQIQAIQDYFPGCHVEEVEAYNICPESAPKGEQTSRGVYEAIAQTIRAGEKPNIEKVAAQLNISKGRVSQIARDDGGFKAISKSLVLLFMALNSETKLSELTEQQRLMALYVFPDLVDKLEEAATPEAVVEALEEFIETAEVLGYESFDAVFRDRAMLSALPKTVLTRLIGLFMGFLPRPFLEGLELEARELIGGKT